MMKNLLFDYDGTLHNTIGIYAPAFRYSYEQLVSDGLAEPKIFTDKEISQWLGYTSREMWQLFMPELTDEQKRYYGKLIGKKMDELIGEGKAELYPNALSTLQSLKDKGYRLIILSNCRESYMQTMRKKFGLDGYFEAYYCGETYDFEPKTKIFGQIEQKFSGEFIMIGDRFHDMEVAKVHHLQSIGCAYGFGHDGELDGATTIISEISELTELL